MKKGLWLALILLCISSSLFAERTAEVTLRFSRQDNVVKIVLESDENVIRNANITASASVAKIDFISPFDLKKPQDFIFETARDSHTLTIKLRDVSDIRTYKLSSPARVVLDMKMRPQTPGQPQQAQNDAQKQQKEATSVSPKTQPASQQLTQKAVDPGKQQGPQSAQRSPEPPKLPDRALKLSTIVIDPGHGGYDLGMYRQEIKEKDISLGIAKELAGALQKKGLKVLLTRKVDQALSLGERINIGNSKPPDLFISIHATPSDKFIITTAAPDESSPDAALRLYRLSARHAGHLDRSRAAAKAMAEVLKTEFKAETISRELPLPILTSIDAAAVLLEYPMAGQKAYDQKERDRLINAIIKGLAAYE